MTEHHIITDAGELNDVVDELVEHDRIALDTEFHRERTYFPKVALVQIAWAGGLVLIDPLAVRLHPLARVLESDTLTVMHAASQDLEVLDHSADTAPRHLFDTQIAAGFLGLASPSLSALHEKYLGKRLPKGDRLTDWLARPLKQSQLDYAASDVADLLEIHDRIVEGLEQRSRAEWADIEFRDMLEKGRNLREPEDAWIRIKETRHLRGAAVGVAKSVAAWRERRAAELDQPVRFILPDLAIVALAQKRPTERSGFKGLRGLDERHLKGDVGDQVLAAVQHGIDNPFRRPEPKKRAEPISERRPAVALVGAWINQLARDLELDPAMLGTRADIEGLVRGDPESRLAHGWRARVAGSAVDRLMSGDAALAFDSDMGLVLEQRSRQAFENS